MTMQQEVIELTNEVPVESLHLVIDFLKSIVSEQSAVRKEQNVSKRIGIASGKKLYADGYDFDEDNDKISEMFGVA